ncbi:MAG: hypothetical protein JWN17_820 [Frankiales bacterium]|nr:hypothetical protein [Frankiales bacterium]
MIHGSPPVLEHGRSAVDQLLPTLSAPTTGRAPVHRSPVVPGPASAATGPAGRPRRSLGECRTAARASPAAARRPAGAPGRRPHAPAGPGGRPHPGGLGVAPAPELAGAHAGRRRGTPRAADRPGARVGRSPLRRRERLPDRYLGVAAAGLVLGSARRRRRAGGPGRAAGPAPAGAGGAAGALPPFRPGLATAPPRAPAAGRPCRRGRAARRVLGGDGPPGGVAVGVGRAAAARAGPLAPRRSRRSTTAPAPRGPAGPPRRRRARRSRPLRARPPAVAASGAPATSRPAAAAAAQQPAPLPRRVVGAPEGGRRGRRCAPPLRRPVGGRPAARERRAGGLPRRSRRPPAADGRAVRQASLEVVDLLRRVLLA